MKIGYPRFSGDLKNPDPLMLMDDLKILQPSIFGSFPIFFNKIYRKVLERMSLESSLTKTLFNKALNTKIEKFKNGSGSFSHLIYDPLIFSKVKNILGGKIRLLISGGAPLA